jgi:electron transport complex protein RnfG
MSGESQAATPAAEPSSARLVATLGLAGLLSGIIIVAVYEATLPSIEAYKARVLREAVFQVLPDVSKMQRLIYRDGDLVPKEAETKDEEAIFAGYDAEGRLVGYAIPGEGPGFQDLIRLLYGYLPDNRQVSGMRILESRETPGLGDKIYKDADFVANFDRLAVDPEIRAVKKGKKVEPNEIDAITGATISSKAVARIMNEANARWLPRLSTSSLQEEETTTHANHAND